MPQRLSVGLTTLRAVGLGAVLLLLVNPAWGRWTAGRHDAPLVLLDASLSMAGHGANWRAALDTAQRLGRNGVIWRFGDQVTAFDTTTPTAGASRLGPALAAAAGRGGPLVVVTDGAVTDLQEVPVDLRRRARVIVVPRPAFRDAFVAAVEGPSRAGVGDTVRLKVSYGTAGPRPSRGEGPERGELVVLAGGRRLVTAPVALPDSGLLSSELLLPVSRLGAPGFHVLTVALAGVSDPEPRDDARQVVLEVSTQPTAVVLAAPPDWETRFLARALEDVAKVPVRVYDETEPAHWRESRSLAPTGLATVQRDAQTAHLLVLVGDPARLGAFHTRGASLVWNTSLTATGDWYVTAPGVSPLAGDLIGIPWDSLPPISAGPPPVPQSGTTAVLSAQLGRRGPVVPIISIDERGGGAGRRVTVTATGLWRWGFRGGVAEQAYRGLVAALANWLLGPGAAAQERVVPVRRETANGLPLEWRWAAPHPPVQEIPIHLIDGRGRERRDTLRFDATGQAELRLPPGEYYYDLGERNGRGVVVVETYSDEWRPGIAVLAAQSGTVGTATGVGTGWRERWWLCVVAIAAFTGEWVWRRRQGLP